MEDHFLIQKKKKREEENVFLPIPGEEKGGGGEKGNDRFFSYSSSLCPGRGKRMGDFARRSFSYLLGKGKGGRRQNFSSLSLSSPEKGEEEREKRQQGPPLAVFPLIYAQR